MAFDTEERGDEGWLTKIALQQSHVFQETHTSTLLDFGAPVGSHSGPSSMAKLVGVPCGIAVQLILDGVIANKGVLAPCECLRSESRTPCPCLARSTR